MNRLAWAALLLLLATACVSGGSGPRTECTGDATACLTGTVTLQGFTATPAELQVSLFREFPATGAVALTTVPIGAGGTWALSGLDPWEHYYLEALASFGQSQNVVRLVGPLSVPVSGGPVAVQLKPAELSVIEQAAPGAALQLQSATAYLFDPSSGAPLQGATVSISVGGTAVPMAWTPVAGGDSGYFASFSTPTPAQATYTITTAAGASWQLVANPPTFTPTLSSPAGATVPVNQPLTVTWPAQAAADEEIVQLFTQSGTGWSPTYEGPALDADVTTATVPGSAVGPAGQLLLLNVSFLQGSCPASSDGCVVGELIVPAQITPQ